MSGQAHIGLFNPKDAANMGGVLRAAACYDAASVLIQGARYRKASTDTTKAWRDIATIHTASLIESIPFGAVPVAIEIAIGAQSLVDYQHPKQAFYIFGPEDGSISNEILASCRDVVYVPTQHCMNLAATVNVVLYDRLAKQLAKGST